jgi:serine/threonine-protein kinase RsbW
MVDSASEERSQLEHPYRIELPARFASLDNVRAFVSRAAKECGMDYNTVCEVELAVDEAFTNIIEHAYGGESHEQIECTCQQASDRLIIVLKDCGNPFDPTIVPEPDVNAGLEKREVGGLGMYFINELVDEVRYSFTSGPEGRKNCNALTMVKHKERDGRRSD